MPDVQEGIPVERSKGCIDSRRCTKVSLATLNEYMTPVNATVCRNKWQILRFRLLTLGRITAVNI